MPGLRARDALDEKVVIVDARSYPADCLNDVQEPQPVFAAVLDANTFLGVVRLDDTRSPTGEQPFRDFVPHLAPKIIAAETPLDEVAHLFATTKTDVLGVIGTNGGFLGAVTVASLLNAMSKDRDQLLADCARLNVIVASSAAEHHRRQAEIKQGDDRQAHLQRLSTVGELTAGLVHGLSQPLSAIFLNAHSCLHALQLTHPDHDAAVEFAKKITFQITFAAQTVQRLKKFLAGGKPQFTSISINQAVQDVMGLLEIELRENSISVQLDLAPSLPPVSADLIQIEQVLLNLVHNGVEAMTATDDGQRRLTVKTSMLETGEVEVIVSDNGPGASKEDLDRLFEPFFTTKPSGMGMGLAISRMIATAHNGSLSISPNPAGGVSARLTLPCNITG